MSRLPLCSPAELAAEIADTERTIDRAILAVPVSPDAAARRLERLAGLYAWREHLQEQLAEVQS